MAEEVALQDEKVELYEKYFDDYAIEDLEDIKTICMVASRNLKQELRITVNYKLAGTMFSIIHGAFIKTLQDFRDDNKPEVNINVANSFAIGYTTKDDADDEKQGNFMFYMRHIGSSKKITEYEEGTLSATERAVQWNISHILKNPEILNKIALTAVERLKKCDINLGSKDLIMPIYCIIYEAIIECIKIKRAEDPEKNYEYEINFMSCFYVTARESSGDQDDIIIRPNIEAKLALKSDEKASSQYE